ncbi:1-aminocyclopropane-1-carboxylate deaminase/D-cysteine desulfhydrase [Algibacillus agarilyticus]|uniref:1-aminocyclopropane-1-carboxylate deaminase/D-cysteine desulfhydrase n=1 Tax=Algibacillus agarilyticus TaxID=2234133 RepID=UPI00130025C0|nr:pyridoxal-phosphate dependent enzyme [Algibacillus agarilyticus]
MLSFNLPSPLNQLVIAAAAKQKIKLWVKRDDLIHPAISGNKWRKLQGYLQHEKPQRIVSFGGAYSNHLHALATLCHAHQINLHLIIRGEAQHANNTTLSQLQKLNAQLQFVDRMTYRKRHEQAYLNELATLHPNSLIIPEGGFGPKGAAGLSTLVQEITDNTHPDIICCPVGSGTTLAGISNALGQQNSCELLGFSAIKKGEYLIEQIKQLQTGSAQHFTLNLEYHFGGFAKTTPALIHFCLEFYQQHGMLLDPVYTGKAMWGLLKLIETKQIAPNSQIVFIHTGGLQGWLGMLERNLVPAEHIKKLNQALIENRVIAKPFETKETS